jgi:Zn-dependent protease with chaperone function
MPQPTTTQRRMRFEQLVREAQASIAASPRAYKLRLVLLALLGYAVLFGMVALLAGLVGGVIWGALASTAFLILLLKKKLIVPLLAVIWVILRSLWVRVEAPTGFALARERFPRLHAEIDELRRRLKTPAVHEVILTDDFNAGISQTPRLGVLGWSRNTLIVGLPLLLTLSADQARAVLAHEFGHLSGNHSAFSAWIYRLRLTWYRVMAAFDEAQGFCSALLRRFFDWYAPYFNAYSFAMARGNEYEADAISVRLTSLDAAAQALVSTHIRSDVLHEHYWRPLLASADANPEPEPQPFTRLAAFLRTHPLAREELLQRISKAVGRQTDETDTHPALRDRLEAMRAPPVLPGRIACSAAEQWLGAPLTEVLAEFDRRWVERNREPWQQRFRYVQDARRNLEQLKMRHAGQLSTEETWQLAAWTEEFDPQGDALPFYRAYAQRAPEDRDADFAIGRLLLARGDAGGLPHLERATEQFRLTLPACELAYDYLMRSGERGRADLWRRRGERALDVVRQANAERESLSPRDTFLASDLPAEEHARLRDRIAALPRIKHAWIAAKRVQYLKDQPLYVIAVTPRGWFADSDKLLRALAENVQTRAATYFVITGGQSAAIAKKVAKAGSQLL